MTSSFNSATYNKIASGKPLGLHDVKALTQAQVSDEVIIRYMRNHGSVYYLGASDVADLRRAGVSQRVTNYMRMTPRIYGDYRAPAFGRKINAKSVWYTPWSYGGSYGYHYPPQ